MYPRIKGRRGRRSRLAAALLATGAAVLVISAASLYTLVSSLFDIYYVITGSMEPFVPQGSIVVVRKIVGTGEVAVGDVVAYRLGDERILHRVIDKGDGYLVTKGDAVARSERVGDEYVEGVMVFGVPWGRYYIGLIALALLALSASLIIASRGGARQP